MTDFLPPVVLKLAADLSDYTEGLARAAAELKAFADTASTHLESAVPKFAKDGEEAGKAFADGAAKDGEKVGDDMASKVAKGGQKAKTEAEKAGKDTGTGFWSTLGSVSGGTWTGVLATGIISLIGAASQLGPVISAAGAAIAALPAATTWAAGGLATLALGFHGIGAAIGAVFAPAMGGAAQSAHQVTQAEWALEQAQRNAINTQQALNVARQQAAQNIKDLSLAFARSKLDIEQATLAVADAQKAYNVAVATGNPDTIMRTNLALRQAQESLDEVKNSADKTAVAHTEADQKGVEGSQAVQNALNAQVQAQHAVLTSQWALTAAMHQASGAASPLATAMKNLAPAAQAFVMEIQRLRPALTDIQQLVQQHMFAGLAADLGNLTTAWLPAARTGLAGLADQFNTMFHGIFTALSSSSTVSTLTTTFAAFKTVLGEVAAVAPRLVTAFMQLTGAATPFLTQMSGGGVAALGHFADYINKVSSNGSLSAWFAAAGQTFHALAATLHDVMSILGSVFHAMGAAGSQGLGVLGALIHTIAQFLASAQGMAILKGLFGMLGQIANAFGGLLGGVLTTLGPALLALVKALQPIIGLLTGSLFPIVVQLVGVIGSALVPIFNALSPAIMAVLKALMPLVAMLGGALGEVITALAPIIADLATVIGQILTQALDALKPIFDSLLPVLVQLVKAILPALVPIIDLVGKVFAALMPILQPLIKLLVDILVPVLKILTPVIGILAPILGLVADALVAIITPIADFIGWLVAGLDKASTWKAIGHWFADLWRDITGWFEKGVHRVQQHWDNFIANVKAIPQRILTSLGDLGSLLLHKGEDLVRGIWQGIQNMESWLYNLMMGWVKRVIPGPILDALGIHSPSTVAADLAEKVPMGLAKGMDDNTSVVTAASQRLAVAMLPTLGGLSAPGVSGGFGGYQPSAPVLPVGAGRPGESIIHLHVHNYLDSRELHQGLIPAAQQYRLRTGSTGLETVPVSGGRS